MTRSTRTSPRAVHGDEIGGAVALAGDDDDAAGLQGYVGNQRISDHDGRDALGQFDELGLIDIDRDGVRVGSASTAAGHSRIPISERPESETARARAYAGN